MASVTKTQGITLLSMQQVAANQVVISNVQDVSTKLAATIFIHFGRDDTSGPLGSPVEFRIEASAKSSGNDQWYPLFVYRTGVSLPSAQSLTGTILAGASTLTLGSTTNFSVGKFILIKNGSILNSEFARIKGATTNTLTLIDALTSNQTSSVIYDQAESYTAQLDLTAIGRLRLVCDASNTNRTVVAEAYMVTGDAIG